MPFGLQDSSGKVVGAHATTASHPGGVIFDITMCRESESVREVRGPPVGELIRVGRAISETIRR